MSYTNPINQSGNENRSEKKIDVMDDVNAYIELIKDNIEYEYHMKYDDWQNKALYEELFEVICEVLESGRIDHSESDRNSQFELNRNSQCTLAN